MKLLVPKTALTVITAAAAMFAIPAMAASAAPLHVAAKHSSKVSVSASPRVAIAGTTVKLSATVRSANPKPTGSVTFWWGRHKLCSARLSNRSGHCYTSFHTAGHYGVRGVYSGDSKHKSASKSVTVVATKASTTTSIVVSNTNPTTAEAVTFTAKVTSHSRLAVTGTVRFLNGKTTLCSAAVLRGGVAHCAYLRKTTGKYKVTAYYLGDGAHYASSRTSGTITVTAPAPSKAGTTTTITGFSKNPVDPTGDSTTVTVTVTSATGTPTGTVAVAATGGAAGLLGCTATLTNGTGTCTINTTAPSSGLPVFGPVPFVATYKGDSAHNGSTSAAKTLEILAPTTTTVTNDATTDTLTATVDNPTDNNISPSAGGTGTVTFTIGGTAISAACTNVPLTFNPTSGTGGTATGTNTAPCSYTNTTAAAVTVTATYSGDGSNETSFGTFSVAAGA